MSTTELSVSTQDYCVYIKATPRGIWDAITKPEWTTRYGYGSLAEYDLKPGGTYKAFADDAMKKSAAEMGFEIPDVVVDGEVIEADPPNRLVQTWRLAMDPESAAEGFTRLTYEIKEAQGGVTKLTIVHELGGAPHVAFLVSGGMEEAMGNGGGGWPWVLSGLKTLLETGEPLGR